MIENCPKLAFVDVETTGGSPATSRITEVAIVIAWWPADQVGPPHLQRWSSLVNPGETIPTEISYLTGIDNALVADAPSFAELASDIEHQLQDAVFVAHHARFDYGFIKAEFARCNIRFQARTLCTVRLSRRLNPDRSPHTLDAIIIRHRLPCEERHRAMGDAMVLWHFLVTQCRDHGTEQLNDAIKALLRKPNLPAHLGIESVEQIPARPGIYFFHGLNAHPLYIGKSKNIRQRISSHFCQDHTSERGIRLASETRRVSWQETAGEFSALLAEIHAIQTQMPAHNRALRPSQQPVAITFDAGDPTPRFVKLTAPESHCINATSEQPASTTRQRMAVCTDPGRGDLFGPFSSRATARSQLQHLASEHGLCQSRLGLERGAPGKPCFSHQLGRCSGACVGDISDGQLHAELLTHIETLRIPAWPNAVLLVTESTQHASGWHLFDRWCWLSSGDGYAPADTLLVQQADNPATGNTPLQLPGVKHGSGFSRATFSLLRKHFASLPMDDASYDPPFVGELNQSVAEASSIGVWHAADSRPMHRQHQLRARWLPRQAVESTSSEETSAVLQDA